MQENEVTIDGQIYKIKALKCRQLKEITIMLKERGVGKTYQDLLAFGPMIVESIKANHPDFTLESLEEATLPEFIETWNRLVSYSGLKVSKLGETNPIEASTGTTSTVDSVHRSGGGSVM